MISAHSAPINSHSLAQEGTICAALNCSRPRRPSCRIFALFAVLFLARTALAADVIVYVVGKNHHFDQFGIAAPTEATPDTWEAGVSVYPSAFGAVTNAAVVLPGPGNTVTLANQVLQNDRSN